MALPAETGTAISAETTGSTTLSLGSITMNADADILIVAAGAQGSGGVVTGVTVAFNGAVSLTEEISLTSANGNANDSGFWYITSDHVDWQTSGSYEVIVTLAPAANQSHGTARLYTNVDPTTPFAETSQSIGPSGTGTSVSITTTAASDELILQVSGTYSADVSSQTGTTLYSDVNAAAAQTLYLQSQAGSVGATTTLTYASAVSYSSCAVVLQDVAGGGGGPNYPYQTRRRANNFKPFLAM